MPGGRDREILCSTKVSETPRDTDDILRDGQRPEMSTAFGRDWTKTPAALLHEEPGGLSLIWASARTRRFRHVGLGPCHEGGWWPSGLEAEGRIWLWLVEPCSKLDLEVSGRPRISECGYVVRCPDFSLGGHAVCQDEGQGLMGSRVR